MMPWPDDTFLASTWNSNAPTLISITNATFPLDNNGKGIDPVSGGWNTLAGFAPLPQITAFINGLDIGLSGFPRLWNISDSIANVASSASMIIDTTTMEPVMHWAELDESSPPTGNPDVDSRHALLLWPAAALRYGRTYIVALRNLVDGNGIPLAPSDGFAALLYNRSTNDAYIEASRPRFEKMFAALESAGVARHSLTLAWSFTVNSQTDIAGQFVHMRDDAFARVAGGAALNYTIASVVDNPAPHIARQIQGWFMAPQYLNQPQPGANVRLNLDASGMPTPLGWMAANFSVVIPTSLAGNASVPAKTGKVMQYGHGLFGYCAGKLGDIGELSDDYLVAEADANGYVMGCINWLGMAQEDELVAGAVIATDLSDFAFMPDRLHQGVLHGLLLMKLMTQSPFVHDPAVTYGGASVMSTDPGDRVYYGNSNGGIYGALTMAVTTDILRGVSGVGGTPYAQLLPRSSDFALLLDIIHSRYADPVSRIALMAVIQERWTRMEPSAYARAISQEPLPGTPVHTILFQHGLGDAQVSWLGVHTLARSAGTASGAPINMFVSNVREGNETLSGFNLIPDSTVITGAGENLVLTFNFGAPEVPFVNIPADKEYDSHETTRRDPRGIAQMAQFFYEGSIINPCGGPCTTNTTL